MRKGRSWVWFFASILLLSYPLVFGGEAVPQWPKFHEGRGKVVGLIPERHRVILDHEAIPSVGMRAMTMSFQVVPPGLLEGLKEGDEVRFKLKETERHLFIVEIEKAGGPSQ